MSSQSNITGGPIAPENNPPINPQYYQPSRFVISAISYGKTTLITTSFSHNYVKGQEIRLLIPQYFGAQKINNKQGLVLTIPSDTQVTINVNSNGTSPFGFIGVPAPNKKQLPQIIALGDINSGYINASGRVLNGTLIEGSFINIS